MDDRGGDFYPDFGNIVPCVSYTVMGLWNHNGYFRTWDLGVYGSEKQAAGGKGKPALLQQHIGKGQAVCPGGHRFRKSGI